MPRVDDSFGKPRGYDDGVKAFVWTQTPDHDLLIAMRARGPNPDAVGVQQQAESTPSSAGHTAAPAIVVSWTSAVTTAATAPRENVAQWRF